MNFTFGRRWKVHELLSALGSQVVARAASTSVALLPLSLMSES